MPQTGVPDNLIQPFQLETRAVRGRLVRLGSVVDTVLDRHDYPEPVARMLGELLVMTAAIAGALKFDGLLTLQTESKGPISMMVADYTTPGVLRGCARYDDEALAKAVEEGVTSGPVPTLLGSGHLAFTVDQGANTELYQGYVGLEGSTLAECAHHYIRQSEQLEAALRLAVGRVAGPRGRKRWRAGGMMIQRLPEKGGRASAPLGEDGDAEDHWRHALALAGSVTDDELTARELGPNDVLYRLFHEVGVRVFTPQDLTFGCRCSRRRIRRILESFSPRQLDEVKTDDGRIVATCEFCNRVYDFADGDLKPQARS